MVKYNEIREEAVKLFEQSKHKQLGDIVFNELLTVDTIDQAVELLTMKAVVFQKLYKKFWPPEADEDIRAIHAQFAVDTPKEKMELVMAVIRLNKAQIIIRDRRRQNRFKEAMSLLWSVEKVFSDQGLDAEIFFVQDEILRVQLEEFRAQGKESFIISEFIKNYETLISEMETLLESGFGDQETLKTWLLNTKFHFFAFVSLFWRQKSLSVERRSRQRVFRPWRQSQVCCCDIIWPWRSWFLYKSNSRQNKRRVNQALIQRAFLFG